jgi:hypothetical protein
MLKPAVVGSGINKTCKAELLDVAKTLKPLVPYNVIYQIVRDTYKSINRIIYNFPLICNKCHPEIFSLQNYEFVLIGKSIGQQLLSPEINNFKFNAKEHMFQASHLKLSPSL